MIEQILREIGLTNGEIQVYLALLDTGQTKVGSVIKRSGISGSKVYEILEKLANKGLVSHVVRGEVKYFEVTEPDRVLDYLDEKGKQLTDLKRKAGNILPELRSRRSAKSSEGDVMIFRGVRGLKNAYLVSKKDVSKGDTVFGMFLPQVSEELLPFFKDYIQDFSKKYKVENLLLFNEQSTEINLVKDVKGVKVRVVPQEFKANTEISIHNNNVIISKSGSKEPLAILIRDKDIADSFKKYFHVVWKMSK